ncbi:MAG: hypothetical protein JXQ65_14315 [Candidatus Marinimicrobia bacterium]|nr:hypothetical protein [Candidatus Neomarinimicrobiota bacterium]
MDRLNYLICIILFLFVEMFAQQVSKPLMTSNEEGVHILLRGRYSDFSGFLIYRKEKGSHNFELLTPKPITDIDDPIEAQAILGTYWDYLSDFLKTSDPDALVFRMKSPDVSTILRYCGVPFAKVLGRYYCDTTAKGGQNYTYKIELVDSRGAHFESIETHYQVEDELPVWAAMMSYEQDKTKIRLRWKAPKYMEKVEDDLIGFNVYRKLGTVEERLNFLPVLRRDDIQWTDERAMEEKTYVYSIKPVDFLGREGMVSATLQVSVKDLIAPLVPEGLTAEKDYEAIRLTWLPGVAQDISDYKIFRAESMNAVYSEIGSTGRNQQHFSDLQAMGGKPYFYKIQAIDNVGNKSPLSSAIWSVAQDTSAPAQPENLAYELKDKNTLQFTWQKSLSPDFQGYYVERGYQSDKAVMLTPHSIAENQFTDRQNFNPGHTYYYYVSALDLSFNQSKKSRITVRIPDNRPPHAPRACDISLTKEGFIEIVWQPSMSLDVMEYHLYRNDGKEKELLKNFNRTLYAFIDSTTVTGKTYSYSLIAVDSSNNHSSEVKTREIKARDILPPAQPVNLKYQIRNKGVDIHWNCKEQQDFAGYNIYVSDSKTEKFIKVNENPVLTKSFYHSRRKKFYKITALDQSGNETVSEIIEVK